MEWNLYLNFLAAMLGIVNPVGIVPMWSELTGDASKKVRRNVAYMLIGTAIVILLVFLITGKFVLNFFFIYFYISFWQNLLLHLFFFFSLSMHL